MIALLLSSVIIGVLSIICLEFVFISNKNKSNYYLLLVFYFILIFSISIYHEYKKNETIDTHFNSYLMPYKSSNKCYKVNFEKIVSEKISKMSPEELDEFFKHYKSSNK